jgi:2-polyprenyl-6-hydroxyphenyl methylase/3-demethylubiquinone-9 3-methyltransferase
MMRPPIFNPDWPHEVQALYRHDMQEIWDPAIAPHVWNQYHNQLDYYLRIAGDRRQAILDVGCAQGTLALLLAEHGHQVTAVDLRPAFLDYARARYTDGDVRFLCANVLEDDIPGVYDLIFANQIIEHLVYPDKLLGRLMACLRPGGRLVVTTPNGDYLKNTLPSFGQLGDPRDWEHRQNTADGDGHFFAYLKDELMGLLRSAGFTAIEVSFFESPMISGHMKLRYLHGTVPVSVLRTVDKLIVRVGWLGRMLCHQLMVTGARPVGT